MRAVPAASLPADLTSLREAPEKVAEKAEEKPKSDDEDSLAYLKRKFVASPPLVAFLVATVNERPSFFLFRLTQGLP